MGKNKMQAAGALKPIPIWPYVKGQIVDYEGRPSTKIRRYDLSLRRWYVVQTEPQWEGRVAEALEDGNYGNYLPKVPRKVRVIAERYRTTLKPMLVGYLFAGFDAINEPWQGIKYMRGVIRVFMFNERPVPMGDQEMQFVREAEEWERAGNCRKAALVTVKVGNFIQVTDGPFASFFGLVTEVDVRKMTLKAEVDLFGRKTPVELEWDQVEVVLDMPRGIAPSMRPQYRRPRSPR